ncbi:MAG TPA: hypothetical protein DCM18_07460 [Ruminococcus sp.]|nr:hypothetical protein [Ruminococcus sp.]HCW13428.1 hypothetical protein [Ruminococcus sp.]
MIILFPQQDNFPLFQLLYFILGLLSCATMMTYCLKKRTFSLRRLLDIGIDSCGALLGSLILLFFVYRADQRHQKLEKGV